ncbi:hypothetical protein [Sphingomonas oryzagri]|uniref:YubB ferredoxin-like domain-containing protein n=1 Tax=Sphingomonas oryzagri TaxID=3042314 RepID=A0ABT6N0U6_9SPHN|nr:hypothetical protein [Sphingomonas oryzagri]MDH7638926.1 hypothetical protein [Sphingomonas oryzagri]
MGAIALSDPCDHDHWWEVPTMPGGVCRHVGPYVYAPRASLPQPAPTMEDFDHRKTEGRLIAFLRTLQTDFHHWSHDLDWTLESGPDEAPSSIDIVVPYSFSGGCNDYFAGGCWNPGDPAEVEIGTPWFVDDAGIRCEVNLTAAEIERIELHILENPPEIDFPEDY